MSALTGLLSHERENGAASGSGLKYREMSGQPYKVMDGLWPIRPIDPSTQLKGWVIREGAK